MRLFTNIPTERPVTPLLDRINSPQELRSLNAGDLSRLADELRAYLLWSVGRSGGHFGAGLGVVELTIALHYCFNTPEDRLVWDVGHQAYPHKILTGRREQLPSIRQEGGLAAFPAREESIYDTFGVGHSSTAISAALGMALAARNSGQQRRAAAIVGDGALTAGMAFEALNHAGHTDTNLLVVLNDNDMSISENVGGLSQYFSRLLASRTYTSMRENGKKVLRHFPEAAQILARRAEEHMKGMVTPGTLFEELGFHYLGPVDGHDLPRLTEVLDTARSLDGPQFLHVITQKGKGFSPAEAAPIKYHAISKIEPQTTTGKAPAAPAKPKYSNIFGDWLCDMAAVDERLQGITPAMREGSDLVRFSREYPQRYFDVAIAEQHAVTLAAGMACEGAKPVVAIYSTFLQRAYDQLIHDVALQNLDVLFAIDRAGLVGEDGPTHAGSFDLTYLRCIPNMVVMAPRDEAELRRMLTTGYHHPGPAAVRYPRGSGPGVVPDSTLDSLPLGKAEILRASGAKAAKRIALLAFGSMVSPAATVAETLDTTLVDMRFIKPLDTDCLQQIMADHDVVVTLEENVVAGGAGSAVAEWMAAEDHRIPILQIGLPDRFLDHASAQRQHMLAELDAASLEQRIGAWTARQFER
ncbi:1-deoxy-D-xylulose-5-phosphate synthase [Natronospirillum operosum]|nr:1-deoxy-D-xylulose-5-phosphate synthase [Natronospirillum operosum]